MKRYIHAATDQNKNKLDQLVKLANEQMPSNHQIHWGYVWSSKTTGNFYINDATYDYDEVEFNVADINRPEDILKIIETAEANGKLVYGEDYDSFLDKYHNYFEAMSDVIAQVAAEYDSDMSYDYSQVNTSRKHLLVDRLMNYNEIYFDEKSVSIHTALGLDAVGLNTYGLPAKYTDGNTTVEGPVGIYYNGNGIDPSIKYFKEDLKRLRLAVEDYFKELAYFIETGDYNLRKVHHEDSYPERAEERALQEAEERARVEELKNKPKRKTWAYIVKELIDEFEYGGDPLYEDTEAGEYILEICHTVEEKSGVWLEPSVQAGSGIIDINDSETDETLSTVDFQEFDLEVAGLASESKNKTEFSKKYKKYLESLIK